MRILWPVRVLILWHAVILHCTPAFVWPMLYTVSLTPYRNVVQLLIVPVPSSRGCAVLGVLGVLGVPGVPGVLVYWCAALWQGL